MNQLTKRLQEIMVPKAVLIAYEYRTGPYSDGSCHLELRPINDEGRMEAAIPVTYEFMNTLLESYSDERQDVLPHGRTASNLIWCDSRKGHECYMWYNPPGKRQMFFTESLNIPDGTFHVPGVIYRVDGNRLDIFSYKGESPEDGSELFRAPFFNVTGSSVCLGNSRMEAPSRMTFTALMEYWEKRFWLSEFSHLGGNKNPTKDNLVTVTEQSRNRPFDYGQLTPFNKQLKDILP